MAGDVLRLAGRRRPAAQQVEMALDVRTTTHDAAIAQVRDETGKRVPRLDAVTASALLAECDLITTVAGAKALLRKVIEKLA